MSSLHSQYVELLARFDRRHEKLVIRRNALRLRRQFKSDLSNSVLRPANPLRPAPQQRRWLGPMLPLPKETVGAGVPMHDQLDRTGEGDASALEEQLLTAAQGAIEHGLQRTTEFLMQQANRVHHNTSLGPNASQLSMSSADVVAQARALSAMLTNGHRTAGAL